jgi:uncharacterized protein YjcR
MKQVRGTNARLNRKVGGLIHEPKLSWPEVNEIRRAYRHKCRTHGLKALAEQYGVSINCIHKIVRGKTWKVTEGDGNIAPPLADKVTAQAFTKALGQYGQSMEVLRAELSQLVQA